MSAGVLLLLKMGKLFGGEIVIGPVFIGGVTAVTLACFAACIVPTLRALRIQPVEAMRSEVCSPHATQDGPAPQPPRGDRPPFPRAPADRRRAGHLRFLFVRLRDLEDATSGGGIVLGGRPGAPERS